MQLGLKLWSINKNYVEHAKRLYDSGCFEYIELSAIPDSYDEYANIWREIPCKYVIHAPHFGQGLNFSDRDKVNHNKSLSEQAFRYADLLRAEYVIFHPGIKGDYRESAKQIASYQDDRMIIENKPYGVAIRSDKITDICVGYSYEQMEYILRESGKGFCLDIGHATCSANARGLDKYDVIRQFMTLNPAMYHISDGELDGSVDKHYHFGNGTYDLRKLISMIDTSKMITIETDKTGDDDLADFVKDVEYLRNA